MTSVSRLALAVLALTAAPAAAQSVRDFQLPPNPTPTSSPEVVGPVDPENPVRTRPRVTVTPTPTPSPVPTATPTVTAPSTAAPTPRPTASPRATVQPTQQTAPLPTAIAPPAAQSAPTTASGPADVPQDGASQPAAQPLPTTPSVQPEEGPLETGDGEGLPGWLFALVAVLLALGGAYVWRRRKEEAKPAPQIEKPVVAGAAAAAPASDALTLRPEAVRMTRSMMAMTLNYRVTVFNRSGAALSNVAIEADLGSASGDRPVEDQVAGTAVPLEVRHTLARLAPGQSVRFEGQLRLPFAQAGIIGQGRNGMLVPLLKLRATANGVDPVAKTHIVGLPGAGGNTRVQPFRLDSAPGGYAPLAIRALA